MAAPMCCTFRFRNFRQILYLLRKHRLFTTSINAAAAGDKKSINVHKIYYTDSVPAHESRPWCFTGGWQSYSRMVQARKLRADRCILVETDTPGCAANFCDVLERITKVKSAVYSNNHVMIELENEKSIRRLHSTHSIPSTKNVWKSRLLSYRHRSADVEGSFPVIADEQRRLPMLSDLLSKGDISSQMEFLASSLDLSELGSRLRFFLCSALEDSFSPTFVDCSIEPYGSSVNGFGMDGCDLDMMVTLFPSQMADQLTRFVSHKEEKKERMLSRHLLATVTKSLRRIPACTRVQRILFARVPIAKFTALDIDCDMSVQNRSGSLMSELMYLYSTFDPRVKPLVAIVKHWAAASHIISSGPTAQPTSFLWLMMVIFFLQTKSVIPSVRILEKKIRMKPKMVLDEKTKEELLPVVNDESLETLLVEFFLFYSTFDFEYKALSLIDGCIFDKPNPSALYIQNPLPVGSDNLAKNVNVRSTRIIAEKMTDALSILDKATSDSQNNDWRLIQLLDTSTRGPHFKVNDLYLPSEELEGPGTTELSALEMPDLDREFSVAMKNKQNGNFKRNEEKMKKNSKKKNNFLNKRAPGVHVPR